MESLRARADVQVRDELPESVWAGGNEGTQLTDAGRIALEADVYRQGHDILPEEIAALMKHIGEVQS